MQRYAVFIGRWRTFHNGHLWLVENQLKQGNPVWVMVRPTDEQPPPSERIELIGSKLADAGYRPEVDFQVTLLPFDVASVNYGRGVGYDVIHWDPPEDVAKVSATDLLSQEVGG